MEKNLVRWKKRKNLVRCKKEKNLVRSKKTLSGGKKRKPCQVNHNHELGLVGRAGGVGGAPAEA